ncbi:hypothetical protein [Streptosporangium sp. NPDC051022]|uniref:hypothetical protein n=1 Tax=Streptosporangium sp. NPDC051022 TaxID=3155752 RepID=UPI00341E33EB
MLTALLELRWEELPPPCRTWVRPPRMDWPAIGGVLCSRPAEWAVVAVLPTAAAAARMAHQIRNDDIPSLEVRGVFEAAARTVGQEHRVYARYMGGEDW